MSPPPDALAASLPCWRETAAAFLDSSSIIRKHVFRSPSGHACRPKERGYVHVISLAEVCRNRTDRSTIGRPAGFEVPDGHQPACTSALILNDFFGGVNLAFLDCSENRR